MTRFLSIIVRFVAVLCMVNVPFGSAVLAQDGCGWMAAPMINSTPNGADGIVRALTNWDPDGAGPLPEHLVAGGYFTTMTGVTVNGVAIRSPLTGQWQSMGGGVAGHVRALAVYNGELIAAGVFPTAGGTTVNNIARWNGTQWSALGSGIQLPAAGDKGVYALAVYNGQLYAGGTFIAAGGITTFGIARWNGASWSTVGTGLGASSEWVDTLTVHLGELVIGGAFTSVGGVAANNVARWNGFFWNPLGSGTNGIVSTTCSWNGELYAGGTFNLAGGQSVTYRAKWNGSSWAALPTLSFPVNHLSVQNNQIWCVTVAPALCQLYVFDGVQWSNITSAAPVVYAITTHDGNAVLGGNITTVASTAANHIAQRVGTLWEPFGGLHATSVKAFHQFGAHLLVGGDFRQQTDQGQSLNGLLAWNGSTRLSAGFVGSAETLDIHSYDLADGSGNHTLLAARAGTPYVMRSTANPASDPSTWVWTAHGSLNAPVRTIERYNGNTYVGGDFTGFGAQLLRNGIARVTTNSFAVVGGGIDGDVFALKTYNGQLYAGGNFGTVNDGNMQANRIVRWNGTAWSVVNNTVFSGGGTYITSLEVHEGRLIIGGLFSGPAGAFNLAAYNGTTVTPVAPVGNGGTNGIVRMLKSVGDRLYVGGSFSSIDGVTVRALGYWDGTAWHEVGGGTGEGLQQPAYAIDQYGDQFHAGGVFNFLGEAGAVPRWAYEQACPLCVADIAPIGAPNGTVNVDDLLAVINAWGTCANPSDCPSDIAPVGGNDVVNVDDLLAVINAWGACPN